ATRADATGFPAASSTRPDRVPPAAIRAARPRTAPAERTLRRRDVRMMDRRLGRSGGARRYSPGLVAARYDAPAMADSPLSGRIVLVTGAGVRVGRAIAGRLAEAGADLAVHYLDSRVAAGDLVAKIRASGRRATAIRADLGLPNDCRRLIRRCID